MLCTSFGQYERLVPCAGKVPQAPRRTLRLKVFVLSADNAARAAM